MDDLISRRLAIDTLAKEMPALTTPDGTGQFDHDIHVTDEAYVDCMQIINELPSAEPEEVIPHRNYKYLSDYWCECGWHLGKKGEVKYCAECGRKVNWDG